MPILFPKRVIIESATCKDPTADWDCSQCLYCQPKFEGVKLSSVLYNNIYIEPPILTPPLRAFCNNPIEGARRHLGAITFNWQENLIQPKPAWGKRWVVLPKTGVTGVCNRDVMLLEDRQQLLLLLVYHLLWRLSPPAPHPSWFCLH